MSAYSSTRKISTTVRNTSIKRASTSGKFLEEAVGGRILVRAIAYVIKTESGEEKNFFEALTKMGIETKVKDLQVFADGAKKADWDSGMAIDAVKLAPKLDTVVLGHRRRRLLCRSSSISI